MFQKLCSDAPKPGLGYKNYCGLECNGTCQNRSLLENHFDGGCFKGFGSSNEMEKISLKFLGVKISKSLLEFGLASLEVHSWQTGVRK